MSKYHSAGIVAVIAAATLVLSACSPNVEPDVGESGAGTLTVTSIPNYQDSLKFAAEKFEEAHDDIQVELNFVDVASFYTSMRTQLSAGTAPDVFTSFPGNGTPMAMEVLVEAGYLMDLSDLKLDEKLPSGMDSVTKVDGKRYVLPLSLGAIGGIYNEQAVAEIGAKIPTTWSELLEFCDAATAAGTDAYAYGAQTAWNNQLHAFPLSATLVYSNNPDFEQEHAAGKTSFSDSAWALVMEKIVEMNDRGCFQEAPLGTSYENAIALVANGDALAMSSVTSTFGALSAAASNADTTFKFYAIPATDDPEETWISAGGSGGYSINADAKNPVAAKLFLDFLATDEMMAEIATLQGALPSISSDAYEVSEALSEIMRYVDAGRIHPYDDQLWPNPEVAPALMDGVQKLIGGHTDVAGVLQAMDKAYEEG